MDALRKKEVIEDIQIMGPLTYYILQKYKGTNGSARVTAILLLCNALTYFRKPIINAVFPTIDQLWINAHRYFMNKEAKHLCVPQLASTYQYDRCKFLYNSMKILWNGVGLEPMMGWLDFVSFLGVLSLTSQSISFLSKKLLLLAGYDVVKDMGRFSITNVIFALEYIRNDMEVGASRCDKCRLGGPDLFLITCADLAVATEVESGDILGNLSGLLTGVLYSNLKSWIGKDPINKITGGRLGIKSVPERQRRYIGARAVSPYLPFQPQLPIIEDDEEVEGGATSSQSPPPPPPSPAVTGSSEFEFGVSSSQAPPPLSPSPAVTVSSEFEFGVSLSQVPPPSPAVLFSGKLESEASPSQITPLWPVVTVSNEFESGAGSSQAPPPSPAVTASNEFEFGTSSSQSPPPSPTVIPSSEFEFGTSSSQSPPPSPTVIASSEFEFGTSSSQAPPPSPAVTVSNEFKGGVSSSQAPPPSPAVS